MYKNGQDLFDCNLPLLKGKANVIYFVELQAHSYLAQVVDTR